MNAKLISELKRMSEEISKDDKRIKINGYIKEKNRYRTKEGKADVVLEVNLPRYDELLKNSLAELRKISHRQKKEIAYKHRADINLVEEAYDSVIDSIQSSLDRFDSQSQSDDKYKYIGNGIKIKKDDNTIYITGKKVEERTIIKEKYKEKNTRLKTKIKDEFRSDLPHVLKTYKIESQNFYKIDLI